MKEGMSYTFILNIVIVFIFVCFAVILGLFSYYKAFKANSIIAEAIEKYEGYNCLSKEEIGKKLSTIGYNTPFDVKCSKKDGHCESAHSYKVIVNNLDFDNKNYIYKEEMNSPYKCDSNGCATNKHYQYTIYTYMYMNVPIISGLVKMPFVSKTSQLYEFRNFYVQLKNGVLRTTETFSAPEELFQIKKINGTLYVDSSDEVKTMIKNKVEISQNNPITYPEQILAKSLLSTTASLSGFRNYITVEEGFYNLSGSLTLDYRLRAFAYKILNDNVEKFTSSTSSEMLRYGPDGYDDVYADNGFKNKCGFKIDYSYLKENDLTKYRKGVSE